MDEIKVTKTQNSTSPLASVTINNPIPPLQRWFKKLIGNEAITIRIPLLSAILLVVFLGGGGLGSYLRAHLPIFNSIFPASPQPTGVGGPTPTPFLKDTALKGTLRKTSSVPPKYYLLTTSYEAITLIVPTSINLDSLVTKRILAIGTYDSKNKILQVTDVQNLEILPTTPLPIPTTTPTPVATPVI